MRRPSIRQSLSFRVWRRTPLSFRAERSGVEESPAAAGVTATTVRDLEGGPSVDHDQPRPAPLSGSKSLHFVSLAVHGRAITAAVQTGTQHPNRLPDDREKARNLRASIVIPTYQRPDLLDRCLAAVTTQRFDPAQYEIIVADDAASPETACQVAEWNTRSRVRGGPQLRYLPVACTQGPAGARNAAWRNAQGSTIAFTDDDTIPDPHWLAVGIAAIERDADAVTGRIVVPLPSDRPNDHQRDTARLADAEFATANCFCRRSVLEALGGFDDAFTAAWREDSDLHFRLLKGNYNLVSAPDAIVLHPVRPAPWGSSLKTQRKSQYNALLYRKHPALYRQRIQPTPPLGYYAGLIGLAAALAAHPTHRPRLATAGIATWTFFTARFIHRRLSGASRTPSHLAEMTLTSLLIPPLSIFWRLRGALRHRVLFF